MSFKPIPQVSDFTEYTAVRSILDWLGEVFKALNVGQTATLNFDATSGKVKQIKIKDGIIYEYTTES